MTAPELRALKDDLDTASVNLRELLNRGAYRLIAHGAADAAGRLLVFERIAEQHFGSILHWFVATAATAEPEPARPARAAAGKRAPKGQGEHRHKFDGAGKCGCGAERQRAPKGSARPSVAERQQAIPVAVPPIHSRPTLGEHEYEDDRFAGGNFGSSSAQDGRNR